MIRRLMLAVAVLLIVGALPAAAQKIDSLALHLHMPRDKAVDAVVSAFTQTGLPMILSEVTGCGGRCRFPP